MILVDVEGFGSPDRTLPHQLRTRAGLYEVVREALAAAGVPWDGCYHEDRGDGVVVLVPPEYPKAPLVEVLPGALARAASRHNDRSHGAARARLRLAVHAGEVAFDEHGATSTSLTTAFRLLDAAPLKRALAESPGVVAVIVSESIFQEVVRQSAIVDPATFRPVEVAVKEVRERAWISLPDRPYPPDAAGAVVDEELRAYLSAARKVADRHTYSSVDLEDGPALPEVHVPQRSRRSSAAEAAVVEPVEAVIGRAERLCLLVAGPGGGKSTALRMRLRDVAAGLLDGTGDPGPMVPVWVSARTLVDEGTPIAEALAAATSRLSRNAPSPGLPAERFRRSPWPGAHWQVLVDDLDEVPDAGQRLAVLEKLANAAAEAPHLYGFVVATRPLHGQELAVLGKRAPHHELLPFTLEDLRTYAEKYFAVRWETAEAARHAGLFVRALKAASLEDPAGTPLMVFMLCRLYLAAPERSLPVGRTAVYEAFTDLVYENNQHKRIADSHEELIARLVDRVQSPKERAATVTAARQAHAAVPELVNHLAHHWRSSPTSPLVEVLGKHGSVRRPRKIRPGWWEAFLEDLLRLTGLLVRGANGLRFAHQTFLEYHAALHATRDPARRARTLGTLVPPGRADMESARYPSPEASYLGFVLDQLLLSEDTAEEAERRLTAVAAHGSIRTIHFLVIQATHLRTAIPVDPLVERLRHLIEHRSVYDPIDTVVYAAAWLSLFDGHREDGAAVLARFVEDDGERIWDRIEAASYLAAVEEHEEEAAQWLHLFVAAALLEPDERTKAAQALARIESHQQCAVTWLNRFAEAEHWKPGDRVAAARALATIPSEVPAAAALLTAFADDLPTDDDRVAAAWYLATIEPREAEGAVLLLRFVEDPATGSTARTWAAWGLAQVDGFEEIAVEWLVTFARQREVRGEALQRMAEVVPDACVAVLERIAEDPAEPMPTRRLAAEIATKRDQSLRDGVRIFSTS
ncbi:NACHT domain-containing protein [Saccharothrix saharensis]|nr:hypothetical protein [Saccharothrix saharensis]